MMSGEPGAGANVDVERSVAGLSTARSRSRFELRHASTHRPLLVDVPERRLFVIHGAGPREAADFILATAILRTVGDTVRAMVRRHQHAEPLRAVLEVAWPIEPGLTVGEIIEVLSGPAPRWRQMIEVPGAATEAMAGAAIDETRRNGGRDTPLISLVHHTEGPAVQILHLGKDDIFADVSRLYGFVAASALQAAGDLHELVIADAHAVGEARARSILRVPIKDE